MSIPVQHTPDEAFLQALNDISSLTGNAGQLAGVVNSLINARNAELEYQQAEYQLATVKIQREMIMRKFDSIDNFIRQAYQERAILLNRADEIIKKGLKRKKTADVLAGLQIIKAVLLVNPLNKKQYGQADYEAGFETLNSSIE